MVAFAACTFGTRAQTTPPPTPPPEDISHVSVELDSGWTLESAIVDGELVGFFGWLPPTAVTPGNVNLVWLEHVGDGAWAMSGWADTDAATAVAAIEDYLQDDTSLDGVDSNSIDESQRQLAGCGDADADGPFEPGGPIQGEPMPSGVTTSDPTAPIAAAAANDPTTAPAILTILELAGATVAPTLSQSLVQPSTCDGVTDLDATLNMVAMFIADETHFAYESGSIGVLLAGCGWPCWPGVVVDITTYSRWTCNPSGTFVTLAAGQCRCRYTGCTRTWQRTVQEVDFWCNVIRTVTTGTEGPTTKDVWKDCCDPTQCEVTPNPI